MTSTESKPAHLSIAPIAPTALQGRWRTEAMRSHATPRLLYINKGQGRITLAGLTSGYGPNNLIFIPAHTMYGFEVGPTAFGQLITIPAAMAPEWPEGAVHLRLRDVVAQKEWVALLDALERELKSSRDGHSRAALYHLGLLSVFFERQDSERPVEARNARRQTASARLVAAYTDLVERDYRAGRSVADYARSLGVTPTHLTRCCKETCGKSALGILNDRVHFEACSLLRDSGTPIKSIAQDLGFRSAAYFTRAFTARSGVTPSAFRRTGTTARGAR
jgi:AraC-like DNA-binding protein